MTEHSQSTVCTDVRQQGGSRPADLCARDIPSCDGMFYSWKHTLGNKTYSQVHNTLNNEMHNAIIFKNSYFCRILLLFLLYPLIIYEI